MKPALRLGAWTEAPNGLWRHPLMRVDFRLEFLLDRTALLLERGRGARIHRPPTRDFLHELVATMAGES